MYTDLRSVYCDSTSAGPISSNSTMETVVNDWAGRIAMGETKVSLHSTFDNTMRCCFSACSSFYMFHRFDDFLRSDGPLLLKEDDPRVQQV